MTQVSTDQLMQIALERAGMTEIPADSAIYHPGTRISNVLVGLEVGVAELFMARQLGYHAVISYAPAGNTGPVWDLAVEQHRQMMLDVGVDEDDRMQDELHDLTYSLRIHAASLVTGRAPALAREVDLPFLNIQTPIAKITQSIVQSLVDDVQATNPKATVADLCDALRHLPSFAADSASLSLDFTKDPTNPLGRVAVLSGLMVPPLPSFVSAYFNLGFDTLCIEATEITTLTDSVFYYATLQEEASETHNIILLGHMACAALGMARYVADLRARGLEVTVMGDLPGLS
jgi:hypothetical protein